MYHVNCPNCGREFTDSENKLSIALTGQCLICRVEEARWESEGGYTSK